MLEKYGGNLFHDKDLLEGREMHCMPWQHRSGQPGTFTVHCAPPALRKQGGCLCHAAHYRPGPATGLNALVITGHELLKKVFSSEN
jgi:hypothetical protein